MRKPKSHENIVCPESRQNSQRQPVSVFDTVEPDGTKVSFGIIGEHKHGFGVKTCKWSGLAVKLQVQTGYTI